MSGSRTSNAATAFSDPELLAVHPQLNADDLASAWAYDRAHRDEIERQAAEHEVV